MLISLKKYSKHSHLYQTVLAFLSHNFAEKSELDRIKKVFLHFIKLIMNIHYLLIHFLLLNLENMKTMQYKDSKIKKHRKRLKKKKKKTKVNLHLKMVEIK